MFEFAHILACICHLFPCFHPFTIFPSECASAWLSRTIHQHTFSHLAGALFTDCMTCLTSQTFLLFFHTLLHFRKFSYISVCTCLSLCLSSHAHSDVFINLLSFCQSVPPHGSAEEFTSTVLVSHLPGVQFPDCITCLTSQSSAELSTSLSS